MALPSRTWLALVMLMATTGMGNALDRNKVSDFLTQFDNMIAGLKTRITDLEHANSLAADDYEFFLGGKLGEAEQSMKDLMDDIDGEAVKMEDAKKSVDDAKVLYMKTQKEVMAAEQELIEYREAHQKKLQQNNQRGADLAEGIHRIQNALDACDDDAVSKEKSTALTTILNGLKSTMEADMETLAKTVAADTSAFDAAVAADVADIISKKGEKLQTGWTIFNDHAKLKKAVADMATYKQKIDASMARMRSLLAEGKAACAARAEEKKEHDKMLADLVKIEGLSDKLRGDGGWTAYERTKTVLAQAWITHHEQSNLLQTGTQQGPAKGLEFIYKAIHQLIAKLQNENQESQLIGRIESVERAKLEGEINANLVQLYNKLELDMAEVDATIAGLQSENGTLDTEIANLESELITANSNRNQTRYDRADDKTKISSMIADLTQAQIFLGDVERLMKSRDTIPEIKKLLATIMDEAEEELRYVDNLETAAEEAHNLNVMRIKRLTRGGEQEQFDHVAELGKLQTRKTNLQGRIDAVTSEINTAKQDWGNQTLYYSNGTAAVADASTVVDFEAKLQATVDALGAAIQDLNAQGTR